MVKNILLVGLGSFVGGVLRYPISLLLRPSMGGFPWGTFVVNIVGCLLIGALWGAMGRWPNFSSRISLLIGMGFCGGFTTFSTFSLEAVSLFEKKQYGAGGVYVVLSLACCIFGVICGKKLATLVRG